MRLPFSLLLLQVVLLTQTPITQGAATTKEKDDWIDPATPASARTVSGYMGNRRLSLVFSDEFEDEKRPFRDGSDTRWTSEDRPAEVNAALQYYNSSHVTTKNGNLVIQTSRTKAQWIEHNIERGYPMNFSRPYTSAMVTTWNKFCFTSGMIEIAFQLPGKPLRGGLWPAFWMMGNLARPNYLRSTQGVWPWSYDTCGTSLEAREATVAQRINNCQHGKGRGSPEIDIIEAQPGDFVLEYTNVQHVDGTNHSMQVMRPLISSSLQLAPGVSRAIRPGSPNFPRSGEWYPALYPMGGRAYGFDPVEVATARAANMSLFANKTRTPHMLNNYWYGQVINERPEIWQDGLSVNWHHSPDYYTKKTILRTEWQAGKDDGYVRWYTDKNELIYEITSETLKNKPGARDAISLIPLEAMYLILNTDISPRWGWNGCNPMDICMLENPGMCSFDGQLQCTDCGDRECLKCPHTTGWLQDFCNDIRPDRPAEYLIDYVRVYQDPNDPAHTVGCDPPDFPTKDYIEANKESFIFDPWTTKEPLVKVRHGGGACRRDDDCGNLLTSDAVLAEFETGGSSSWAQFVAKFPGPVRESYCVNGRCKCPDEWTGPFCQSPCIGEYAHCQDTSSAPPITHHVLLSLLVGIASVVTCLVWM